MERSCQEYKNITAKSTELMDWKRNDRNMSTVALEGAMATVHCDECDQGFSALLFVLYNAALHTTLLHTAVQLYHSEFGVS